MPDGVVPGGLNITVRPGHAVKARNCAISMMRIANAETVVPWGEGFAKVAALLDQERRWIASNGMKAKVEKLGIQVTELRSFAKMQAVYASILVKKVRSLSRDEKRHICEVVRKLGGQSFLDALGIKA
jgi:hypothetical protein